MNALFILNDAPYGSERVYNALRLAQGLLAKDSSIALTVFLLANAELTAKTNQKTPDGYYNIERMLKRLLGAKCAVLLAPTPGSKSGRVSGQATSIGTLMDTIHESVLDELNGAKIRLLKLQEGSQAISQ